MELKATLQVLNQADYPGRRGVTDGQTYQRLIGWPEVNETDRVRLGRATYAPELMNSYTGIRLRHVITWLLVVQLCVMFLGRSLR